MKAEGGVISRYFAHHDGVDDGSRDGQESQQHTPITTDRIVATTHQGEGKDARRRDEDTDDIVLSDPFAQQYRSKERTEQRRGGEQGLGYRRTIERIVGKGLEHVIEKRLAEAGDQEKRNIFSLQFLQAQERTLATDKTDQEHEQHRRHEAQDDERERRQYGQGMLDSNAAHRPDDHRGDQSDDGHVLCVIPAKRHTAAWVSFNRRSVSSPRGREVSG